MRDELVNARRDRFFGAYMQKAKQGLKINIREDMLAQASATRRRRAAASVSSSAISFNWRPAKPTD